MKARNDKDEKDEDEKNNGKNIYITDPIIFQNQPQLICLFFNLS